MLCATRMSAAQNSLSVTPSSTAARTKTMNVSSSAILFSFSHTYGQVRAVVALFGLPRFGCLDTKSKQSLGFPQQRFFRAASHHAKRRFQNPDDIGTMEVA